MISTKQWPCVKSPQLTPKSVMNVSPLRIMKKDADVYLCQFYAAECWQSYPVKLGKKT